MKESANLENLYQEVIGDYNKRDINQKLLKEEKINDN